MYHLIISDIHVYNNNLPQGGAMSLFCGLQLPLELKPAGLVIMSGYLPGKSKFTLTPGFEDIPIFHTHGTADLGK